jgi:uncharacterized protein (DUF2252 family)
MAADLAETPVSGLLAQLCGDAHLANFGLYASPDRRLVFDINDFDETLSGPWEWDVKRLATSIVVAGRDRGFDQRESSEGARAAIEAYRTGMATFSQMRNIDIWYAQTSLADLKASSKKRQRSLEKVASKARSRTSMHALNKLAEETDAGIRIKSDPPLVLPLRELPDMFKDFDIDPDAMAAAVAESYSQYLASLSENRRHLLSTYRPLDIALKVVGVGSVGTRCSIVLLEGRDTADPLFLQIKEAGQSVLAKHLDRDPHESEGRRVVAGQRLMQATSDVFLGWSSNEQSDFYWRQLRDMKGSFDVDSMDPRTLVEYAALCGWTLARSHARSGDAISIAGYLGSGQVFIEAVTEFACSYADQNDRDYATYLRAIADGRVNVEHH